MGSKICLQTNTYMQVLIVCRGSKGKLGLRRSLEALEEVTSELSLKGKPTKNRVRGGEDISDT